MSASEITKRQWDYALAVKRLHEQDDRPPTLREIAEHMGVTLGTVQEKMALLRDRGVLTWEDGKARTLQLLVPDDDFITYNDLHAKEDLW